MRIFVDTASLAEIEEWDAHPWVSGFTTNPTLFRSRGEPSLSAMAWAKEVVRLTDKPVSIDGPCWDLWVLGSSVYVKMAATNTVFRRDSAHRPINWTAVCTEQQVEWLGKEARPDDIISVFAGRIMDTGRDPISVINAALATGAQVLWASVREPYNIVMAEDAGCDIVTVPTAILRKWLDWQGKPLEVVAAETIAQFEKDSEGLWEPS